MSFAAKDKLSKELEELSKGLVPSDKFIDYGLEAAHQVFLVLQADKKYDLDRCKIVGSIGKSTAICVDSDFDLVVFINKEEPPFRDVLKHFHDVLLRSSNIGIKIERLTQHSIKFRVRNICFDLLGATNLVTIDPQPPGAQLAKLQWEAVMAKNRKNPKRAYEYSSSAGEQTIEFLSQQSSFVHEVARIAKFWNKTLILGYIPGRSTMIEVIAINAARFAEAGNCSKLDGFMGFLSFMSKFSTLSLTYPHKEENIPAEVKNEKPLVLDPVNPFNNYAGFKSKKRAQIIDNFQVFAVETLKRMGMYKNLSHFFDIQPCVLSGPKPLDKYVVGIYYNFEGLVSPAIETILSDQEYEPKRHIIKDILTCFVTNLVTLAVGTYIDEDKVVMGIKRCVDLNVLGLESVKNRPSCNKECSCCFDGSAHKRYHVTFSVPLPYNPERCAKLSLNW